MMLYESVRDMSIEPPKPIVKIPVKRRDYGKGVKIRVGRGFSLGELKAAGLSEYEARKIGIYVDKNRKSVHDENVKALKEWKEKVKTIGEKIESTFPKVIIVKRDLRRVFKGKTAAGRRVRGLLSIKYRYTHNYKWKRKNRERKLKKKHEAARHKGGH